MNRTAKIIGGIVGVLVLIVAGAVAYLALNTNALVKDAIETLGSRQLGVPVHVRRVDISLREGRGRVEGLEIANPPGYAGDHAMQLGALDIVLDVAASSTQVVVVKSIEVAGAEVRAVIGADGKTNFSVLMDNVKRASGTETTAADEPSIKLIIDRFDFTGASATATMPLLGKEQKVSIADVHVRDIGRKSGGATASEVTGQLIKPIVQAVVQGVAKAGISGGVEEAVKQKFGVGLDKLKELGHPSE